MGVHGHLISGNDFISDENRKVFFSNTLQMFSVRLAKTLGPPVLQSFEANGRCKKPQLCKNLPNAALSNVDY